MLRDESEKENPSSIPLLIVSPYQAVFLYGFPFLIGRILKSGWISNVARNLRVMTRAFEF